MKSFSVKAFGTAAVFGMQVALARILGKDSYGIYLYALAWINMLAVLSLFGMNNAMIRFVASYHANQQLDLMHGLFRKSFSAVLLLSLVISVFGIGYLFLLSDLEPVLKKTFYYAFVMLPILSLVRLRETALRAFKSVVKSGLLLNIFRPAILTGAAGLCFVAFRKHVGPDHIMLLHLLCLCVIFLIATFWLYRTIPYDRKTQGIAYDYPGWLKTALPLLFIDGTYLILNQASLILMGLLTHPTEAGLYAVAAMMAGFGTFGTLAINIIAAPLIAELNSLKNISELQRVVSLSAAGGFFFCLAVGIAYIFFGKWVLGLYGTEFVQCYAALLILWVGHLTNSLAGPVEYLMVMTRYQTQAGAIVLVCGAINLFLNILLIPHLHLIGAAAATAFSMVLWNVLMAGFVYFRMGILPAAFWKIRT